MEQEKLGSSISNELIGQLEARADLFSTRSKTLVDIQKVNSNDAWVKLRSSVNTLEDSTARLYQTDPEAPSKYKGSSQIAKENILSGGTVNGFTGNIRQGVEFPDRNPDPAYRNTSLGPRPMPGITDFKLKSKGNYGMIQEAEISFIVWSVEDLSLYEKLYFRPGYTALVEWGHSIYIDNDGNLKKAGIDSAPIPDSEFFDKQNNRLEELIAKKRKDTYGNYDGFLGFIVNFNWSFREDGGYECMVKVVSKGAILNSLKNTKNSEALSSQDANADDKEATKIGRKSLLHRVFSILEKANKSRSGRDLLKEYLPNSGMDRLQDFTIWVANTDIKGEDSIKLCYLPLRAVIDMLNEFGTLKNPTDQTQRRLPEFSIQYGEKFATHKFHFTCDPLVAFPPAVPAGEYENYSILLGDNIHAQAQKYFNSTEGKVNDVLNIPVCTYFLKQVLNETLEQEGDSNSMLTFIRSTLSGIQSAFGGINRLDLHTFDDIYRVVDRESISVKRDQVGKIDTVALRSIIKSMRLESKLSNDIASMVAIAAQGNTGNYQENVATILEWNYGVVDRHFPIKQVNNSIDEKERAERRKKFIEDLNDVWYHFNDGRAEGGTFSRLWADQEVDINLFSQLKPEASAENLRNLKLERVKAKQVPQGVIPIELSMTILGIAGLKIGTTFRITQGILPVKYDSYGFIITGISHSISSDNIWYTSIDTQFFSLRGVTEEEVTAVPQENIVEETPEVVEEEPTQETPNADRLRQAIAAAGYSEKGEELSNGGDITPQTADYGIAVINQVKANVPGVSLRFTGGNDVFHQEASPTSRHTQGKGLDFVLSPATPANINRVKEVLQGFSAGNLPNARFLDEYSKPTVKATGKHFHISWGPGTEGNRNLAESKKLADQGKIKTYRV